MIPKEERITPKWKSLSFSPQIKTFSLKEKSLEDQDLLFQREEGYLKISSEDQDSQVQNQLLKTEIESEDFIFVHLIANIRDCTQILWNTIQISFVHIFVITNFGKLGGTISTSHLFLQN